MLQALKPDGLLILEAFTPDQLIYQEKYQSGGPPKEEMLNTPEILRQDLAEAQEATLHETVTEL